MTERGVINNPILRGFNPDPSILRVGHDYYIATSTFEWFPGCQIHHSTDLVNWQLITRPLDRSSQLDLVGVPDSCGVWAPCLSFKDGLYYLVYSNVKSFSGVWKDTPNYLVTAEDIMGPWSEPTYLNSSGFDASLFHDDDGKSYLLNMLLDHRENKLFGGIILQEYEPKTRSLVGQVHYLYKGTELGCTEGPHLYKHNGYYYLLLAEGGTGYDHCVTLLRSKNLLGPYELHPKNPIISTRDMPNNYLQKTGHADLVQTPDGQWYAVFLASRPLTQRGRCTLGRETAIVPVVWGDDDWLYLDEENSPPPKTVMTTTDVIQNTNNSRYIDFKVGEPINIHFQALRHAIGSDWADVTARPGFLRLVGRESLSSTFHQSLLGHRLQAQHAIASTCIEFTPANFQQMAGLVCYYNTRHYHYLHIRGDGYDSCHRRKYLTITCCDNAQVSEPIGNGIDITGASTLWLRADFNGSELQFFYALTEGDWLPVGPILDGSILSDDYVAHTESGFEPCFTGAFFAICCQDLSGHNATADFAWFDYREMTTQPAPGLIP